MRPQTDITKRLRPPLLQWQGRPKSTMQRQPHTRLAWHAGLFMALFALLLVATPQGAMAQNTQTGTQIPSKKDKPQLEQKDYASFKVGSKTYTCLFYEGFDTYNDKTKPSEHYSNMDAIPAGWNSVSPDGKIKGVKWRVWYGGGGKGASLESAIRSPAEPYPNAYPHTHTGTGVQGATNVRHITNYDESAVGTLALQTPTIDLSTASEPVLLFWYYSQTFKGTNTLKIQYKFQGMDKWEDLGEDAQIKDKVTIWTLFQFSLTPILQKANGDQSKLKTVQLAFVADMQGGFGNSIDEVAVVDMKGEASSFVAAEAFNQPIKLIADVKDQPIGAAKIRIETGAGRWKLENFSAEVEISGKNGATGTPAQFSDAALYRTSTPEFSADRKVCDLEYQSNKFTKKTTNGGGTTTNNGDDALNFESGTHYLWVVAKPENNSAGQTVTLKLSKEAVTMQHYTFKSENKQFEKSTFSNSEKKLPASESKATSGNPIYSKFFDDNFDDKQAKWSSDVTKNSESNNVWQFAEPATGKQNQPSKAYSGYSVLGTGTKEGDKLVGKIDKVYPDYSMPAEPTYVWTKKWIDASTYRNVHIDFRRFASTSGQRLQVEVAYYDEQQPEIKDDNELGKKKGNDLRWTTGPVLVTPSAISDAQWAHVQQQVSQMLDRRKFALRFRITSTTTRNPGGIFLDDLYLIGEKVNNDVNVKSVTVEPTFDYSTAKAKVTYSTLGNPTGNIVLYVNGEKVTNTQSISGTNGGNGNGNTDKTAEFDLKEKVKAANGAPVPYRLEARFEPANGGTSDEAPENNMAYTTIVQFPKKTVSDTEDYPQGEMNDWYPLPKNAGGSSSWVHDLVTKFPKAYNATQQLSTPFGLPPSGQTVWTTGAKSSFMVEQSALHSPIFTISGSKEKSLVIAYALVPTIGATQPNKELLTVKVQYAISAKPSEWKTLENTKGKEWYTKETTTPPTTDDKQGWFAKTDGYVTARTQLPAELKNLDNSKQVQFRVLFDKIQAEMVPGLAVNFVDIHSIRPDLKITRVIPFNENDDKCARLPNGNLKIEVKNISEVEWPKTEKVAIDANVKLTSQNNQVLFSQRKLFNVTIDKLEKDKTTEIEIPIGYNWADQKGNKLEVTIQLNTKNSTYQKEDEDPTNNTLQKTYTLSAPDAYPIKDIVTDKDGKKVLYLKDGKGEVELQKQVKGYNFSDFKVEPATGGTATVQGDKLKVTGAGQVTLKYKSDNSCELELKFEVKAASADYTLAFTTNKWDDLKCANNATLKFNVTKKEGDDKQAWKLRILQNGKEVASQDGTGPKNDITITIPNDKLENGKSTMRAELLLDNGDYKPEDNSHEKTDVDVFAYPAWPPLYLVDQDDTRVMKPIEEKDKDNVVTYGNTRWLLYMAPQPTDVTVYFNNSTSYYSGAQDLAPGKAYNLGVTSGQFQVGLAKQGCTPARKDYTLNIKNDDLELVSLVGVEDGKICKSEQGVPIVVTVRNNSQQQYAAGSQLKFEVKIGGTTQKFDHPLSSPFTALSSRDFDLGFVSQNAAEKVTVSVEILGHIPTKESNPVKDANPSNDKKEYTNITIKDQPKVTFTLNDQAFGTETIDKEGTYNVTRKVFLDDATTKLAVKTENSTTLKSYQWSARGEFDDYYVPVQNGAGAKLTIQGKPEDVYRVKVTNQEGCSSTADLYFPQRKLEAEAITSPTSNPCDARTLPQDIRITLKNPGKHTIPAGRKLKAKVKLADKSAVKDLEIQIPQDINPGATATLTIKDNTLATELKKAYDEIAGETGTSTQSKKIEVTLTPIELTDLPKENAPFRKWAGEGDINASKTVTNLGVPDMTVTIKDATPGSVSLKEVKEGNPVSVALAKKFFEFEFKNGTNNTNNTNNFTTQLVWTYPNGKPVTIDKSDKAYQEGSQTADQTNTDDKFKVPTEKMKQAVQNVDLYSGDYHFTFTKTDGSGCAASIPLRIAVNSYDLEVTQVQAPFAKEEQSQKGLCDIVTAYDPYLIVSLKNNSSTEFNTENIEKVTVKVEAKQSQNNSTTGNAIGTIQDVPVDLNNNPWKPNEQRAVKVNLKEFFKQQKEQIEGKTLTYTATVSYTKKGEGIGEDGNKTNDTKNITLADWQAPKFKANTNGGSGLSGIKLKKTNGSSTEEELEFKADSYTFQTKNEQSVEDNDEYNFKMYGIEPSSGKYTLKDEAGKAYNGGSSGEQSISASMDNIPASNKPKGPHIFTLTLKDNTHNCTRDYTIVVSGKNPHFAPAKLLEPGETSCVAADGKVPVKVQLQNMSTASKNTGSNSCHGNLTLTTVIQDGATDNKELSNKVETKVAWTDYTGMATKDVTIDNVVLNDEGKKHTGTFQIKVEVKADNNNACKTSNKTFPVTLLGEAQLNDMARKELLTLDNGKDGYEFYKPTGIEVKGGTKFTDIKWLKDGAEQPIDPVTSKLIEAQHGDYTLQAKYGNSSCMVNLPVKVRYPGFIAIKSIKPKDWSICKEDTKIDFDVEVWNPGKESLDMAGIIYFDFTDSKEIDLATSKPTDKNNKVEYTSSGTLAAGASTTVTLTNSNFNLKSEDNKQWDLTVKIIDKDGSNDKKITADKGWEAGEGKTPDRGVAECSFKHLQKPKPANLDESAKKYLTDKYKDKNYESKLQSLPKRDEQGNPITLNLDASITGKDESLPAVVTQYANYTWSYNDLELTPAPTAPAIVTISPDGVPQKAGKYQVTTYYTTAEGARECEVTSDAISIMYEQALELATPSVTGLPASSTACATIKDGKLILNPTVTVTLKPGSDPALAGTTFTCKATLTPTEGGTQSTKEIQLPLAEDAQPLVYKLKEDGKPELDGQGNPIVESEATPITFAFTDANTLEFEKNKEYKIKFEVSAAGKSITTDEQTFSIKAKPTIKTFVPKPIAGAGVFGGQRIEIDAVKTPPTTNVTTLNVEMEEPSNAHRFSWDGIPAQEIQAYDYSANYTLSIQDGATGCETLDSVEVFYYIPFNNAVTTSEGQGELQIAESFRRTADQLEDKYKPSAEVTKVQYNEIIYCRAKAADGFKFTSALVKGNGTEKGYSTATFQADPQRDLFTIDLRFKVDEDAKKPDAVGSELLANVRALTPFMHTIVLFNAQGIESYELFNLQGQRIQQGRVSSPTSRLEIAAPNLPHGVYLIRLRDANGALRTLRLIRANR